MNESVSDQGRGKFIVFEGLDGSGKTTQIKSVSLILREKGIPVHINIRTRWNGVRRSSAIHIPGFVRALDL